MRHRDRLQQRGCLELCLGVRAAGWAGVPRVAASTQRQQCSPVQALPPLMRLCWCLPVPFCRRNTVGTCNADIMRWQGIFQVWYGMALERAGQGPTLTSDSSLTPEALCSIDPTAQRMWPWTPASRITCQRARVGAAAQGAQQGHLLCTVQPRL